MAKTFKKKDGSTVIKGSDGKIAGNLPAASTMPKPAPEIPAKMPTYLEQLYAKAAENKIKIQREQELRSAAREVISSLTDSLEARYPNVFTLTVDENNVPVSIEDRNSDIIKVLDTKEDKEVFDAFAKNKESLEFSIANHLVNKERRPSADGAVKSLFLAFRCAESPDCQYRTARYGFAPSHEASQYCMSGRRSHCTCDTCF